MYWLKSRLSGRAVFVAVAVTAVASPGLGQDAIKQNQADEKVRMTIEAEIKKVIALQADAWNRGSIDDFMEHYWKSDQLTFSSGGKTTKGWTATHDGYKKRYATAEKMGRVSFDQLEVTLLGDTAALVLGRWKLDREKEPVGGNFSLVFRRIDNRWVIIHDHTSRDEASGGC